MLRAVDFQGQACDSPKQERKRQNAGVRWRSESDRVFWRTLTQPQKLGNFTWQIKQEVAPVVSGGRICKGIGAERTFAW